MTQERDGLEMLVRFYDNHNQLMMVEGRTGVPVCKIKEWLNGGKLSDTHRDLLSRNVAPEFTGKVKVG